MKELLEKLSSYNIFNYLLPGVVFVAISNAITDYNLIQKDIIIGLFLYYFIGLIISRVGSVIIEPILKKIKFIQFSSYGDYINASKKDNLLEILSEANNLYRTLCSLFICIVLLKTFEFASNRLPALEEWSEVIIVILLLILFALSYRKQTQYINQRIENATKKD